MKQEEALCLLKMGKNVFLTGAAGAGKTYLLNQFIRYLKENRVKVAVTASTGIAATHLYGTTIHSWSGIGVLEQLTQRDLDKIVGSKRLSKNYKKTNVLIIDEVSMLHPAQLNMLDQIARRILEGDKPFGGLQVVLTGDFFQLPPVSTSSVQETCFAFESHAWINSDFHICYLTEQHRQVNDPLLTVLNDIRSGQAGEQTKVPLRTRYKKEPEGATKPTRLYARNVNVDAINERELAALHTPEKTYHMTSNGIPALVSSLKKGCLALEALRLKVGAEVMFIKNDPYGQFANGTRGVVIDFDDEGNPIVRTYQNKRLTVSAADWNYEENEVVLASITQVPLRLAWAITIHKSQGMTLDAAEMDLGDTFELGMGYVALSRVRKLSGLKLMNLNEMALKVHPKVLHQDHIFRQASALLVDNLNHMLIDDHIAIQKQTLVERFKVGKNNQSSGLPKVTKIPTSFVTLEYLEKQTPLETIAENRGLSVETILNHIEQLKGLKKIGLSRLLYLKNTISNEDFEIIASAFKQSEDGKLKTIFELLGEKYAYHQLKLVRLLVC